MIISIHQICFLPWVGFFAKIRAADKFVLLDHVQFSKQQYDNRVLIKTKKEPKWISVPIKKGPTFQKMVDVEVDYNSKWQSKIKNLIKDSYQPSQYFADYFPFIDKVLSQNYKYLHELNLEFIFWILGILQISTPVVLSSSLDISHFKGHDLNIEIVKKLNGTVYLSGVMGNKYLMQEDFKKNNIKLIYQDINFLPYPQQWGSFINGLSIMDCLFNCGSVLTNKIITNSLSNYTI